MNLKSNTDKITTAFNCDTNSIFVVLCENGRSYSFTAEEMVSKGNKEFIHINTLIRDIRNIVFISIMNDDKYLFASSIGYGFVSSLENLYSKNKAGKTFMTGGHVKIFEPKRINDDSYIHLISSENKELAYSVSEIKDLPKGKGVMLMRMTPTLSIKKITVTNKVKNEAILGKRAMTGKNLK
jgi:topoisomerase-4 subunit A